MEVRATRSFSTDEKGLIIRCDPALNARVRAVLGFEPAVRLVQMEYTPYNARGVVHLPVGGGFPLGLSLDFRKKKFSFNSVVVKREPVILLCTYLGIWILQRQHGGYFTHVHTYVRVYEHPR